MKHFAYIDRLKGFTILVVVMGHLALFSLDAGSTTVFRIIQSFEMPLFMFLSGLVISTPPLNLTKFKVKAKRYLVPWFVFGSFLGFCIHPQLVQSAWQTGMVQVVVELSRGPWYLLCLTLFCFTLVAFRLSRRGSFWFEALVAGAFYVLFHVGWRCGGVVSQILCLEHAATYYPFFVLGYWTRKYEIVAWLLKRKYLFMCALIVYLLLLGMDIRSLQIPHVLCSLLSYFVLPITAIIVCIYVAAQREEKNTAVENHFATIGRHSLGIYLLHGYVVLNTDMSVLNPFFAANNNQFLLFLLLLAVGYVITWGSIWFERLLSVSDTLRVWLFAGCKTKVMSEK